MSSKAEDLPPEIWLSIFTFFEGHELVRTFSCLNSLFDSFLCSSHLQLYIRIKKDESNERLPASTWSYINRENICTLTVGRRKANCLIQFLRWNAPYLTRLSSLSVYLRKSNIYYNLQFLLFALGDLPSLKHLRIKYTPKLDFATDEFQPLLTNIFNERFTITKYSLICDMTGYNMATSTWSINPSLKSLYFNNISFSNLFSFLSFTPQLRSLRSTIRTSQIVVPQQGMILPHLRTMNLFLCSPRFAQLQILKDITPNLQSLRLSGLPNTSDDDYFQENLWMKLLDNIHYFHVNLRQSAFDATTKATFKNLLQNFNGKSWLSCTETPLSMTIRIKFQSKS